MGWYLNSKQNNSQKSPSAVRSLLEQQKFKLSPADDAVEDSGLMEDVVLHSHMQQATVEIYSHYSQYNTIRGWGKWSQIQGSEKKGKCEVCQLLTKCFWCILKVSGGGKSQKVR